MSIRDSHDIDKMTTDFGIPVWSSYAIFAIATIMFGLLLGLVIVFLCDFMLPNSPPQPSYLSTRRGPPGYRPRLADDEDKDSDIVVDDLPKPETKSALESLKKPDESRQTEKSAAKSSDDEDRVSDEGTKSQEEISDAEISQESGDGVGEVAEAAEVQCPKSARRRKIKTTTD